MKEEFLEAAYSQLSPGERSFVLGLAVAYIAIVVYQKAVRAWPSSRRERRVKAMQAYLAEDAPAQESTRVAPSASDDILKSHLRDLVAEQVFRKATGIRCKAENRQLWIQLYQDSGDDWTWQKIASASRYFILQQNEIRYRVKLRDRLLDMLFFFLGAAGLCGMVLIFFRFGSVAEPKQVTAVVASMLLLLGVAWTSFSMMLPLGRAARLRKELDIPFAANRDAAGSGAKRESRSATDQPAEITA